jgi:uncharacterized protein YkwD
VNVILVVAATWLFLLILAVAILRTAALADRAAERRLRDARSQRASAETRRRATRAALIIAALPMAGAAINPPDADAQACQRARSVSRSSATLCFINRERRAHGLVALQANAKLARAARRHASDMVLRSYFAHDSLSGLTFGDRLHRVGYVHAGCTWSGGETLAWGTGAQISPASRVAAWMQSPPHRAILLGRGFREAGLGIVGGVPGNRAAGFTYVGDFARRRC